MKAQFHHMGLRWRNNKNYTSFDQKFIMHNCSNIEEQPPQAGDAPFHHSPILQPASSSSSMETLMLEKMTGLYTIMEQMQL